MVVSIHRTRSERIYEPAPQPVSHAEFRRLTERKRILEAVAAGHGSRELHYMALVDYHADLRRAVEAEVDAIEERLDEFGGGAA